MATARVVARRERGLAVAFRLDMHIHTRRYSACSAIDPDHLIRRAVRVGLDGIVITEHHYQWTDSELAALVAESGELGFVALSAFEYSSSQGDFLIYGLKAADVSAFEPGRTPEEVVELTRNRGGVCIAAHPTRAGLGFDDRIATLQLDGLEVCSVNLQEHERRLATSLATALKKPMMASSDAHRLEDVGRYATEFNQPILCMADLRHAISHGRFRPAEAMVTRV